MLEAHARWRSQCPEIEARGSRFHPRPRPDSESDSHSRYPASCI